MSEVDWSRLQHAYGRAGDVPELLATVAGDDAAAAAKALDQLTGSVAHQGTTYSASVPVVPLLVDLLLGGATHHRAEIAWVVGDLAASGNHRTKHLGAVRAAVTAEVERLLPVLADPDEDVREAAAYTLAQCPKRRKDILPVLRARFAAEPDPHARASILAAVHLLDPKATLAGSCLGDDMPLAVRAAAAIVLAKSDSPWPTAATDAVRAGWADGRPLRPCRWWEQPVSDLLLWSGWRRPDECAQILLALLESSAANVRQTTVTAAISVVSMFRSARSTLLAALTNTLTDPVLAIRATGVLALREMGGTASPAADALAHLAGNDPDEAGGEAAAALIELADSRWRPLLLARLTAGEPVSNALVVLADRRAEYDEELCHALAQRLAALRSAPPPPEDPHNRPRWAWRFPGLERPAILALLAAWGPAAQSALAGLAPIQPIPAAGNAPRRIDHIGERVALWRIARDPAPALDAARAAVEDLLAFPGRAHIRPAVELLDPLGAHAVELLPDVCQVLDWPTGTESIRRGQVGLARWVWQVTGDATAATATVRRILEDAAADPHRGRWGWSSRAAVKAAEFAADLAAPPLVPPLRDLLSDASTRTPAATAIWRTTGDATGLVEPLTAEAVAAGDAWPAALELLAELGPAAAEALPQLRDAAGSDQCPFVDPTVVSFTERGVGHDDDRYLAGIRRAIQAIEG